MAYDQSSAYHPPQRPYYNQQAPQSPAYEYQYDQYDQYGQPQQHGYGGQWEDHQNAQYDGAYGNVGNPNEYQSAPAAYRDPRNNVRHASPQGQGDYYANNGHAIAHNNQGYAQHHAYSVPRGGTQSPRGVERPRGPDVQALPPQNRAPVPAATNNQERNRPAGGEQPRSQEQHKNDKGVPPNGATPNSQPKSQSRAKPVKERILQREDSPVTLSFDNPFPMFPTKPKPKDKPKTGSTPVDDAMASMSIKSGRSSGDRARPPTASSSTRSKASQASSDAPRSSGSTERTAGSNREIRPRPPDQVQYRAVENHRAAPAGYVENGPRRPAQAPTMQQAHAHLHGPPPVRSNSAEPQRNGAYGAPPVMPDNPLQHPPQRAMTMPQTAANNVPADNVPQFDMQWPEPGPVAGYHGPASPTFIPPRPPTASSNYSGRNGTARQPEHYQSTNSPPELDGLPLPQKQHAKHQSLSELYDQYYDSPRKPSDGYGGVGAGAAPEEEMPNFDAQPAEWRGHRRGNSLENHLDAVPNNPAQSQNQEYRALNPESSYQQQNFQSQPVSQGQNRNAHSGINGFVFEMPGDIPEVTPAPYEVEAPFQPNTFYHQPPARGMPPSDMRSRMIAPPNHMHNTQPPQPRGYPAPSHQFHRPRPGPPQQPQPPMVRNFSPPNRWPEQGTGRDGPDPYAQRGPGPRPPMGRPTAAMPLQQQAPPVAAPRRNDPDALPQHPTPVRPGLMDPTLTNQPAKPPPIRQYNNNTNPAPAPAAAPVPEYAIARAERRASAPVTHDELDRLRGIYKASPSEYKSHLRLAKKLVEAASVLADEGGRADARTRTKNREKYIFEAHKIVKKLVNAGYPDAMFYLADCYGQGLLGLEVDTKEAFSLYQAAAKAGHPASAYRTAVCCEMGAEEGGGTRRDPLKAVQWYKRAAALGDTPAMYKMGMIMLKGLLGQPRNIGDALTWLKRAAETADEENPHALHELGLLYENPPNTDKIIRDEPYALQLFQQAADLGYKFSQFRLGQAYEYGNLGLPIDARSSIAWYTRAAAQGEHQSELALSGWYLTGSQGILDQSDTEAYLWARKAACSDPPLPKAMFAMGYFTEVGIGCPRSLEEAKRWYGRAASQKFPKAQERLEELKRGGDRVQKNRERLSRSNQKQHEENCRVM